MGGIGNGHGDIGTLRTEGAMAERLGLAVIPGVGWSAREIKAIAREAEEAGFDAIVAAEVNNDVMATAQLMGAATERIQVGTWIANIYLRHSYTCAQGAALIADATGGRFVLGLGVSHEPINRALEIAMPDPLGTLRRYVTEVRGWLRGEGPATHLPQRPAAQPVPLYVAAMTSPAVELAGELADGIMPLFWPPERIAQSKAVGRSWPRQGAGVGAVGRHPRDPDLRRRRSGGPARGGAAEPRALHGPALLPADVPGERFRGGGGR